MLIKDQSGNLSFTHVDNQTDLSFVKAEVKFMEGKCEIALYENETACTDVIVKIQEYLSAEGFKFRVIRIQKDGIFTNGDKSCKANSPAILDRIFFGAIKPDNPLPNWNIQCGFVDPNAFQINMYCKQLNNVIASQKSLPIIRYENGKFSEEKNELLPSIVLLISQGFMTEVMIREFLAAHPRRDYINEIHQLMNETERLRVLNHVLPRLIDLYEENPEYRPAIKKLEMRAESVAVKNIEINPSATEIQKEITAEKVIHFMMVGF